jgi:hypothetical protein
MKLNLKYRLLGAALLAMPALTYAQPTAHYVPGVEGIKGASLPPPGVYLRDYNAFYYADTLNDIDGHAVPGVNARAFIYANVPRLLWITHQQLFGGYLGVDALLPLQYTELKVNPFHDQTFGIGDFFAEGTWSKHLKQFDLSLGYGIWAPTGDFSPNHPTWAGLGYWTHMFTAGATWYIDKDKKWAVSALNRYEINQEQDDTDVTRGEAYTLEWGISRSLLKTVDVGAVGYYQQQVTEDYGRGSNSQRDRVAGIGPEISAFCPKLGINTSLRYEYEFLAEGRLQGHTIALTLTKAF